MMDHHLNDAANSSMGCVRSYCWPRTSSTSWLIAACGVVLFAWAFKRWKQEKRRLPPGPWPLPVVGNLLHLMGDLPHVHLARLAERHGPLMCLRLGSKPMVVASSADMAREFLQTHDRAFASRPPFEFVERAQFGQGNVLILAQHGDHWRHVRRVATSMLLSAGRLQEIQPLRREELRRLLQGLLPAARAAAAVDLTHAMSRMVEDVVCRMILRRPMSEVVGGGANLKELAQRSTTLFLVPVVGDFIPWLGFLDRRVKRALNKLHHDVDALWESVISEREEQRRHLKGRGDDNPPVDILDAFLSDPSISRSAVKGCMMDLIGAGIDTTSTTLDWAMAELLNNPTVLKKLQAEIGKVVGSGRSVEVSDLERLPYVAATVKETLRLHAPAPLLVPHMATEACNVMGYSLPKGTRLMVNIWAIASDPGTWKEPNRFLPERFLTLGDQDPNQQFWWIPFSSGRRTCPGAPFALPTLELTIANLVHCYDWRMPDDQTNVDMSAITSAVVHRAKPLLAIPTLRINASSITISNQIETPIT